MKTIYYREKHDKDNRYVMLSTKTLFDKNLNVRDVGLLLLILSYPDKFNFNKKHMLDKSNLSEDDFNSSYKKLYRRGYIYYNRIKKCWEIRETYK